MIEDYDLVYEAEGGDIGGLMGFLLYGPDVELSDVEGFINDNSEGQEYAEGLGGDFDAVECWVRKVPRDWGFSFVYADRPGPGARRCVRIDQAMPPRHWCVNHPFEPYQSGVPVEWVADPPWPMVVDGYVHLCRDCSRRFHARRDVATAEHMLAYYEEKNPEHAERARASLRALQDTLARVLEAVA